MGYRSEVAMALGFDTEACRNQFIAENYDFGDDSLSGGTNTIVFYVDLVKFYPDYSGPSAIQRLWNVRGYSSLLVKK